MQGTIYGKTMHPPESVSHESQCKEICLSILMNGPLRLVVRNHIVIQPLVSRVARRPVTQVRMPGITRRVSKHLNKHETLRPRAALQFKASRAGTHQDDIHSSYERVESRAFSLLSLITDQALLISDVLLAADDNALDSLEYTDLNFCLPERSLSVFRPKNTRCLLQRCWFIYHISLMGKCKRLQKLGTNLTDYN